MENNEHVTLRPAEPGDAEFIAWGLATALGASMSDFATSRELSDMIRLDDVFYSWRHATIALWDGAYAGVSIAYDGGIYPEMRQKTFRMLGKLTGYDYDGQDDEAYADELYIDTLAVLPSMRRRGIGRALLEGAINAARKSGFARATLAVHPENLKAQALYKSLGFQQERTVFIFGEDYWRMVHPFRDEEVS